MEKLAQLLGLSRLLLLKRTPLAQDPIVLSYAIDYWPSSGTQLLDQGLQVLDNERVRTFALRSTEEQTPLAQWAIHYSAKQIFMISLPVERRHFAGLILAIPKTTAVYNKDLLDQLQFVASCTRHSAMSQRKNKTQWLLESLGGWLGTEIQKFTAELESDYRSQTLLSLSKIIAKLSQPQNPQDLSAEILRSAVDLIKPAESGVVFILENGFLLAKHVHGLPQALLQPIRLSPGEGLPGKTYAVSKPMRLTSRAEVMASVANLCAENQKIFQATFKDTGIPTSAIAVPLFRKNQVIGVLILDTFSKTRTFSQHDLELLQQFSNLSAIALENARLIDLAKLRAFLLDQMQEAVIAFLPNGEIAFYNRGTQRLLAHEQSLKGVSLAQFFAAASQNIFLDGLKLAMQQKRWSGELIAQKADGTQFPALISVTTVETNKGLMLVSILANISERNRMQALMHQATKMESLEALAGGIAHDFNNFLGIILGYAAILQEKLGLNPEHQLELDGLQKAAYHAAELTEKLMIFSRGKKLAEKRSVQIDKIIMEALQLIKVSFHPKIEIETQIAPNLPNIFADPVQLEEVVMNLALNAKDAMPDGGTFRIQAEIIPREQLSPALHQLKTKNWLHLVIEDSGDGMSEDECAKIFDPFYSTKKSGKGSGLGCSVVYSVVTAHGGFIEVSSKLQKGTTFHIYLPTE